MKIHTTGTYLALLMILCTNQLEAQTAQSVDAKSADKLIGLWKAEREFVDEMSGDLDLYHDDEGWTAQISRVTVPVGLEKGILTFEIPGDRGRFRGRLSKDSSQISGHWIQPPAISMSMRFASPVKLEQVRPDHWRGMVTPMRDYMTFFFLIMRGENGAINAVLRNPQLNYGRFYRISDVTLVDGNIKFLEKGRSGTRLPASYYSSLDMFSITIPNAGGTFDFWRVDDSTSDFYPRRATNLAYTYRPPVKSKDGWQVASLEDVGMKRSVIEDLVNQIISTPMDSINSPYIHSLLISRRGKLVVEEYFHGYDGMEPHDTRSASKSFTTTLVGAAIEAGLPIDLSTLVYEAFYTKDELMSFDQRKRDMTVEHLITMTPGLACSDGDSDSPGNEDVMQSQSEQPDWAQYTLDLPMEYEPGTHAAYCSGSMNLAGAVLSELTELWLPDFFQTYCAEPLQMGLYHMNLTPSGRGYGAGGLRVTARDFLKLGYIYLNDGMWNGNKLLNKDWIARALAPQSHMGKEDYGYGFWLIDYEYQGRMVEAFYAGGNGGQYVIGIPDLELLVTFFAGNYNQKVMHKTKYEYVPQYILRAIE